MSGKIKFENPPPRAWLADAADELRRNPGRWALLLSYPADKGSVAKRNAWRIRTGQAAAFRPAGQFNAVSRRVGDRHHLYVIFTEKE